MADPDNFSSASPAVQGETVLVTGATGFIGRHVARVLGDAGANVRVLVRGQACETRVAAIPGSSNWEIASGDLLRLDSLKAAMQGVRYVFHVAGDYRFWARDFREIEANNVQGTINVMEAAAALNVERVVYTSTPAILAGRAHGALADERELARETDIPGPYKRSKFRGYRVVEELARKGFPVVTVLPTAPIGCGDVRPTPTGRILVYFANGKIPCVARTGLNFANVKAVAKGHLLALLHGKSGDRYLVGGENLSLKHFLQKVGRWTHQHAPRICCPYWISMSAAVLNDRILSPITGREPFVTSEAVRMSRRTHFFSSAKAEAELGYEKGNLDNAVHEALVDFAARGLIRLSEAEAFRPAEEPVAEVAPEG